MKTIDKEMSLFGDLYYNATREEVAKLADSMKQYPISAIASYLKVIMQDVLAHLAGSTSFVDACMVRDKLHFESKINNRIGKKKLVELLALLEELDKLGIHMDEIPFMENENDEFLNGVIKERRRGLLLDYLRFTNLNEFFDMAMMIVTIMPMAVKKEDFDSYIPDPSNFDFKNIYYESIDYLLYYLDKEKYDRLRKKHESAGTEVNLCQWIKNYKNRYTIKDLLREEMGLDGATLDRDNVDMGDIPNDMTQRIINFASQEYDFTKGEIERIGDLAKENIREINVLKEQISEMRDYIQVILETQYIKLSDIEYERLEEEFVMETFIKHVTKKTRKKRVIALLVFSAVIASIVLIPTFDLKPSDNRKIGQKEYVAIEDDASNREEIQDDRENDNNVVIPDSIPVSLETGEDLKEDEVEVVDGEEDKNIYKTEFVLGETVSSNVPFYISSTSDEILGFLDEEVITIGYFATLNGKNGPCVLCSCRNQEQIDKFLRLYHGDGTEIIWRAAVTKVNDARVQKYLASGEEIPYELTTCYIDCVPAKELDKIRGK